MKTLLLLLCALPAFGADFFIHSFHKEKFGGDLDCSMCHVAVKQGSVTLKRPGHDQCMTCHADDFTKEIRHYKFGGSSAKVNLALDDPTMKQRLATFGSAPMPIEPNRSWSDASMTQ